MKNPFYKFQLPANAYKLIDTSVGFQVAGDYHGYDSDKDGKAGIVISVDNKPIVEVENKEILFKTNAKDNYKILSSFIGLDGNSIQGTKNKSIAELAVPLLKNIENIETKGKNTFAERSALITYKKELNRLFDLQERGKGKSEEEVQKAQTGGYLKGAGNYNWKRNTDGSFEYMENGKDGKVVRVGTVKRTDSNYNKVESNLKQQIPSLFNESSSKVDTNTTTTPTSVPTVSPLTNSSTSISTEKDPLVDWALSNYIDNTKKEVPPLTAESFNLIPNKDGAVAYKTPTIDPYTEYNNFNTQKSPVEVEMISNPENNPTTDKKEGIKSLFKGVVDKVLNNKGLTAGDLVQLAGHSFPYWKNKHSYPTVFKPNYVDNQPTLNMMKNTFIPALKDYRAYNTAKSQIDSQSTGALNLASKVQLAANQGRLDSENRMKEYVQNQQFNQDYIKGLANDAQMKNQAETLAADLTQKSHGVWDAKQNKAAEITQAAFNKLGTSLNQNKSDKKSTELMMEFYGIKQNPDGTYSADPTKIAALDTVNLKRIQSFGGTFDTATKANIDKAISQKEIEEAEKILEKAEKQGYTKTEQKGGLLNPYSNPYMKSKSKNINPYY